MVDSFVGFLCTFHTELYISELVTEPKQVCHFCIKWNFLKGASKSFALYGINFVSPLSELSDVRSRLTFRPFSHISAIRIFVKTTFKPLIIQDFKVDHPIFLRTKPTFGTVDNFASISIN